MKNTVRFITIMIVLLALAACQLPASVSTAVPSGNTANATDAANTTPSDNGTVQPKQVQGVSAEMGKSEDTVRSFLSAYQDDPKQMKQFLSKKAAAKLPKAGAAALLQFNGNLDGFNIQSAAVSPANGVAQVEIEAQVGGNVVNRVIVLVKEGDKWVIDSIKKGKSK